MTLTEQVELLHSSSRRYCMERHAYWAQEYAKLNRAGGCRDGMNYTPEALAVFPRYNVLNAILTEVETFVPADFDSPSKARELLSLAGQAAENIFTTGNHSEIERRVMQEERDCFSRFIETVSEAELEATTLYPYRRVLKAEEARTLHESLFVAWKARGYYYPLKERERDDLEAFQSEWFAREVDLEKLRERFMLRGIKRIIELKEYGSEYETDISIWEPHYDGAEGFWTSQGFEWLVYASHESSVTFGGWALSELKSIWPAWEKRIWNSPFHKPPTK